MPNLLGQSLGRYQILEQLGEGGMALVYKAYDTRLEAEVAVKVIRTEKFTPEVLARALKRFEREAKALARLTHANIVNVIDYGEHKGSPYLVMPFMPGGNLKTLLKRRGKLPWQEAVRVLLPVARALAYAHGQKVIHRDVKPSNILITASGDLMLTDFGVAKVIEEEVTLDLTGTAATVGTPEYMAPEQGLGKNIDARADIYSLGIVLYELITGHKPYTADTPMAVVVKHIHDPVPRPSQFVPSLPEGVEQVLLKALAKNPADRYQNMAELATILERLSHGASDRVQPVKVKSKPVRYPEIKPKHTKLKSRSWIRAGWLGASIASVIIFLIVYWYLLPVSSLRKLLPSDSIVPALKFDHTTTTELNKTMTPTPTLSPIEQSVRLAANGSSLYLVDHYSRTEIPVLIQDKSLTYFNVGSWSPDGDRFVFDVCPSGAMIGCDLYIANRDGGNATPLLAGSEDDSLPAWSPDGQLIAFVQNGNLSITRPSNGASVFQHFYSPNNEGISCIAWSPDSQHITWIQNIGSPGIADVWVIDADGRNPRIILDRADSGMNIFTNHIAWSPDGNSVAVMTTTGETLLIDVNCVIQTSGCDESSRTELDSYPFHWESNFYPQWAGEDVIREP